MLWDYLYSSSKEKQTFLAFANGHLVKLSLGSYITNVIESLMKITYILKQQRIMNIWNRTETFKKIKG